MADYGTVARPYARAIFDTAAAADALDGWSQALASVAAVTADRAARDYLGRPELTTEDRSNFVSSLAWSLPGGSVLESAEGRNLIRLLSENDRLDALGEISRQFDALKAERENTVRVTLVAASEVDAEQADKMAGALSRRLGRQVELALEVDPSLIGGAVVKAEDMVIDDSVKTRLERLTNSLID